ncbi:hypothetical protein LshimejAT787_3000150 [Lyophyllum shimeji]|uniref:Uncharacterized protein n=1 Tax=Lyophyllum shimeji TaxID=47721 RepID=A0A9P3UX60_LYOSH|nr:hypothetical protein LshimejAT787_3000150 [Lyophyllum shimeji]
MEIISTNHSLPFCLSGMAEEAQATRSGRIPKKSFKRKAIDATKTVRHFFKNKKKKDQLPASSDDDDATPPAVSDSAAALAPETPAPSTNGTQSTPVDDIINISDSSQEDDEDEGA